MTEECGICCEPFTGRRQAIECPMCEVNNCIICCKTYLLGSTQEAHCMACRKVWSKKFCHDTFPKSWLQGDYRKSRQRLALEREKALLPITMPIAAPIIAAEKEMTRLTQRVKELTQELRQAKIDLYRYRRIIAGEVKEEEVKETKYTFPCPAEGCRGFIEGQKWSCGLCKTKICKSCHVIKDKEKHVCRKEDKETAKLVVKETKPCPACATRIFKLEGCDQMFCTQCYTAFSWETGEVQKGVIHNPHYYEIQQKLGSVPRNRGDQPCGGMDERVHHYIFETGKDDLSNYELLRCIVQRVDEVNYLLEEGLIEKNMQDVRINYLRGEISDRTFTNNIFRTERYNEKIREEREILETFRVATIERLNSLFDETGTKRKRETKVLQDIQKIVDFCNNAFEENFTVMGYAKYPQIDLWTHYVG